MKRIVVTIVILAAAAFSQTETLTNKQVIEMSKSGLPAAIILQKIKTSENSFDVSVRSLIELREAGVDANVIALMMDKAPTLAQTPKPAVPQTGFSESVPEVAPTKGGPRTIALEKSSLHPSRQALEKELLKRREWERFNLAIIRYKESADFFVEIGRVPLSLLTHRYTYRIFDRRSGAVIGAGETTSWGSLAKNLAREIAKTLDKTFAK
ncbi:MAG TPA: hypothetical protein PKM58_10365 [Pyrinomonadaceae bacterium]|nr:hypothetical protein [Pyrinomonadaceae bacterium]HNU07358.1 hypothetical protein [Pyrinomonadaceae bacterium]